MLEQAERIYRELTDRGVDVLFDDRDVSPGVKFADADLVGVPVQIVVGAKGFGEGRSSSARTAPTSTRDDIPLADVVNLLT